MKQYKLRAVQLDLARQMEPLEWIKNYIVFLSEHGYNGLMLYLEDRIITPGYPYPNHDEAYTTDEIRTLVLHGEKYGIELFPCIATLGHAERFLRHKELSEISEMRSGAPGRFGGATPDCFCTSSPEFYRFIAAYLKEVSDLFPSTYFHVGLDEAWNFNRCEICRAKAPDFQSESKLFAAHVNEIHNIVKALGKKMLMWADMFEIYHDILPEIPRDIILVDWQYQKDVRFHQAHFNNLAQSNNLKHYADLGFNSIIAPSDFSISNARSYLEFAENAPNVIGCIVTNWEKNDSYQERLFPLFAWAGHMMNGEDTETAFTNMMRTLFPNHNRIFAEALKSCMYSGYPIHFTTISDTGLFSRSVFGLDYASYQTDQLNLAIMESQSDAAKNPIISDLQNMLREKVLAFEVKELFMKGLDFGCTDTLLAAIENKSNGYLQLLQSLSNQWGQRRPKIKPNIIELRIQQLTKALSDYRKKLQNGLFLRIRLANTDWYGVPHFRLSAKYHDTYHVLSNQSYKPEVLDDSLFEQFIPMNRDLGMPEQIKIEDSSFGGVGIAYLEIQDNGKIIKRPAAILSAHEKLSNPEFILSNDAKWLYLGDQSVFRIYERKSTSTNLSVEILLQ